MRLTNPSTSASGVGKQLLSFSQYLQSSRAQNLTLASRQNLYLVPEEKSEISSSSTRGDGRRLSVGFLFDLLHQEGVGQTAVLESGLIILDIESSNY